MLQNVPRFCQEVQKKFFIFLVSMVFLNNLSFHNTFKKIVTVQCGLKEIKALTILKWAVVDLKYDIRNSEEGLSCQKNEIFF